MDNRFSDKADALKRLPSQSPSEHAGTDGKYGTTPPPNRSEPECATEIAAQAGSIPLCNEADCLFEEKYLSVLTSFETIFKLLQRSEEARSHLEELCHILTTSRTVPGLIRGLTPVIRSYLELTAVRILFREDHPISSHGSWDLPEESGIIPPELLESEPAEVESPFVIDNPSGRLSRTLFKADRRAVASAAAASLRAQGNQMGLLCLASDDPARFAGGMNTETVASLAEIISLGILNAWEHEQRCRTALVSAEDGFWTETAFHQFLTHECARASRHGRPFTLAALSWHDPQVTPTGVMAHVLTLLRTHVRSSDVVSVGDNFTVWFLLPESGRREALNMVQRLCAASKDLSDGSMVLHAGIAPFTSDIETPSHLATACRLALQEAQQYDHDCAMVRSTGAESTDSRATRTPIVPTHTAGPAGAP